MPRNSYVLSHQRQTRICAVALGIWLFSSTVPIFGSAVMAADSEPQAAAQTNAVMSEVSDLVKEYFPKAKITTKEKSMHFEFKAKERINPYTNRTELSPDLGGIFGDLDIKPGQSKDKDKLPTERHETIHSVLLMAPYSAPDNTHLATRLAFQPDTPNEFMLRFRSIVNGYQKGEPVAAVPAPASAVTSVTTAAATPTTVSTTTTTSTTAATPTTVATTTTTSTTAATPTTNAANPTAATTTASATTFGASKLSKYSYPEGRFKVLLPGSPQMKYTTQAGMRMVDYAYPEAHGTFNISYVILPAQPDASRLNLLVEKMSESVVTSVKGANSRQTAISLQSFPGRQIDISDLKDKPGQSARFRLYVVRRYVYIVGVAGKKAWLNSPVANEFLNSFAVSPELNVSEEMAERRKDYERQSQISHDEAERRHREFDQKFNDSLSRARKDSEKFHAEFNNNRYRR